MTIFTNRNKFILILLLFYVISCDTSKKQNLPNHEQQNVIIDSISSGLDSLIVERKFIVDKKRLRSSLDTVTLLYAGKRNDSTFCYFMNDLRLFDSLPNLFINLINAELNNKNINQYTRKGYSFYIDISVPTFVFMFGKKDTIVFYAKVLKNGQRYGVEAETVLSKDSIYKIINEYSIKTTDFSATINDSTLSIFPFKIGDKYETVMNKLNLRKFDTNTQKYYVFISDVSEIDANDIKLGYLPQTILDWREENNSGRSSGTYVLIFNNNKLKKIYFGKFIMRNETCDYINEGVDYTGIISSDAVKIK